MKVNILPIKKNCHNLDLISKFEKISSDLSKKKFTNYYKYIGENMDTSTTSNAQIANDPGSRAMQRMYTIGAFFVGLVRQVGIFCFGVFIGLGVVLRNPPEDKKSLERIAVLESENKTLASKLKNFKEEDKSEKSTFSNVKESVIIKN